MSNLNLEVMKTLSAPTLPVNDQMLIKLAREIAMDINSIEDILVAHSINEHLWQTIKTNVRFVQILSLAIEDWGSAKNTGERVRLKSLSFIEEALPEFFARAHDAKETLSSKVEVLKTVAKFAGVDSMANNSKLTGEKFSVTINMGEDRQLKIEKDITPQVTIEHESLSDGLEDYQE